MRSNKVNNISSWLKSFLPAPQCALCRLISDSRQPLCRSCRDTLSANTHYCCHCAVPLATDCSARVCGSCLRKPPPYSAAHVPWLYRGSVAELIQQWKFRGASWLTPLLGDIWLRQPLPEAVDIIIPVPLHWRRHFVRGYNQAALLADYLYHQLRAGPDDFKKLQYLPNLLVRQRYTRPQSRLGFVHRQDNLRGVFGVKPFKKTDRLAAQRVALVDDVFTTGATACALSELVLGLGASQVFIWCLARTPAPRRS